MLKRLLKKSIKFCSSLTWGCGKKFKICVTIRTFKMSITCSCLWEAAIQECSQKVITIRSSHQDVSFNTTVLNLWSNYLKNTCDGVHFLVNLYIILFCFWPLVQKSCISSNNFVEQQLLWNTSRKLVQDVYFLKKQKGRNSKVEEKNSCLTHCSQGKMLTLTGVPKNWYFKCI